MKKKRLTLEKRITLRLDKETTAWLEKIAEKEHRPVGAQIRFIIDKERNSSTPHCG